MSIAAYPDHPLLKLLPTFGQAAVFPGRELGWAELRERSLKLARALPSLGVRPGDLVAILLRNSPEALTALAACWAAGAVAMPLNARWRERELAAALEASRPQLLLTASSEAWQHGAEGAADPPGAPAGGTAVILHSSGTEASPKACLLDGGRLARNARAAAERFAFSSRETFWNPLPLYHVGGLLPWLALASTGGRLLSAPHFEASSALSLMERRSVTFAYPMFPHIFEALREDPAFEAAALPSLRAFVQVAPEPQLWAAQAALPHAAEISAYGSTEACAVSFGDPNDEEEARLTSCGRPLPGVEVAVRDGELLVRGGALLTGWVGSSLEPVDHEGWYHTGDAAALDGAGRIRYLGRLADILKVGGENVSPTEVEAWLCAHPAVRQAVVVGLPDKRLGEVPAAAVELRPGRTAGEAELIEHCRSGLAAFKIPRSVRFLTRWPMSATKISRNEVRALLYEA